MKDENDGYKIKITQLESAIRRLERLSSMDIRGRAKEADSWYIAQWKLLFLHKLQKEMYSVHFAQRHGRSQHMSTLEVENPLFGSASLALLL